MPIPVPYLCSAPRKEKVEKEKTDTTQRRSKDPLDQQKNIGVAATMD